MPLRVKAGCPVIRKAPLPTRQVSGSWSAAVAALAVAVAPTVKVLPNTKQLRLIHQKTPAWCYAACAEIVFRYYGLAVKQCQIASFVLRRHGGQNKSCCTSPEPAACVKEGCDPEDIVPIFETQGIQARFEDGFISLAALQQELNENRPVEVGVKWRTAGNNALNFSGHVMLAMGWKKINRAHYIYLIDPAGDSAEGDLHGGWNHYGSIKKAFGQGEWRWTWLGLKKP